MQIYMNGNVNKSIYSKLKKGFFLLIINPHEG